MATQMTLGFIIRGEEVLLKRGVRGVSKGKWNGPGGKIEGSESPLQGVVREVEEETGLTMVEPFYHGLLRFYFFGSGEPDIEVHVFSTRKFEGSPRPSEEGEVRWFAIGSLPWDRMWDDDRYWYGHMLEGRRFDADFHFDMTEKVSGYSVRLQKR